MTILWVLEGHDNLVGWCIALGMLIKWFPVFVLGASWRYRPIRRAVVTTIIAIGIVALVFLALYLLSPEMVKASLNSRSSKGSWETVWALVDGNLHTGNFSSEAERYDPDTAFLSRGNPSRVSPWLTLSIFLNMFCI